MAERLLEALQRQNAELGQLVRQQSRNINEFVVDRRKEELRVRKLEDQLVECLAELDAASTGETPGLSKALTAVTGLEEGQIGIYQTLEEVQRLRKSHLVMREEINAYQHQTRNVIKQVCSTVVLVLKRQEEENRVLRRKLDRLAGILY